MSRFDLATFAKLAGPLRLKRPLVTFATNSINLRFALGSGRADRYIWVDPPWELHRNDQPFIDSFSYEERLTTCRKNGEEFRFVVLCEANRPNDRVQIQLGDDKAFDYIEVECKPKKLALRPNTSLERTRER